MARSCTNNPVANDADPFTQRLFDQLDYAAMDFLCANGSNSAFLVNMWDAVATIGVAIIAFNYIFGGQGTAKDLMLQIIKIAFILIVVQTADYYTTIFYWFTNILPNGLAAQLVVPGASAVPDAAGVNGLLSDYLQGGQTLSGKVAAEGGGLRGVMFKIQGALISLVGVIFAAAAMLLITLAKLATAVLLAVGPFFLIALMFTKTQGYFTSWFKALMSFALIPLILYALMALIVGIGDAYLQAAVGGDLDSANAFVELIAPYLVISLIGIALITQVQGIAAQLAGGMALSTQAGLGWAGRQVQRSAGRGARNAASNAGQKARAGVGAAAGAAGTVARSPVRYAKGVMAERNTGDSTGSAVGNAMAGVSRVARNVRRRAQVTVGRATAGVRSEGVAMTAGRATTRAARKINTRRINQVG